MTLVLPSVVKHTEFLFLFIYLLIEDNGSCLALVWPQWDKYNVSYINTDS